MHPAMLDVVIRRCRERYAAGDCPCDPPFSVEQLEDAVIELADTLAREKGRLPALAAGLAKFAPDLAEELTFRWQKAGEREASALEQFLGSLRNGEART